MADIKKSCSSFLKQSFVLLAVLTAVTIAAACALGTSNLKAPLAVSLCFFVPLQVAEAMIWRKVAGSAPDALPNFFTAVSGFRMLLALAVLTGCCLVAGRDAMLEYCLVFMGFYVVLLVHHSLFFAKASSNHSNNDSKI